MNIVVLIKTQIACLVICVFIGFLYFSSKRQSTRIYRSFGRILMALPIYLISDIVTVYSVNRLSADSFLNATTHRFFLIMLIVTVYLFCNHMNDLIEVEEGKTSHRKNVRIIATVTLVVTTMYSLLAKPEYVLSPVSNYAAPRFAGGTYCAAAVYIVIIVSLLIRHRNHIPGKTFRVISAALIIESIGLYITVLHTELLLTGFILTFMTFAFYITLENPDAVLLARVEEEKDKADQANASKSAFVSAVSHEIRTPMNAIVGMTDLMLRDSENFSEKQKGYLNNIKNSGTSLVMIVNDILDMSKIETGKMELVESVYDLKAIVSDVRLIIENLIAHKPIELIIEIGENVPDYLMGDGLRIRQILINLLNNAVKYTNKGYVKLIIAVADREPGRVLLDFVFEDTGIGIRKEDLDKLGEAFTRMDEQNNHFREGSGLGLSISKHFIEMMGGKLTASSVYGRGSEFNFSIWQNTDEGLQEVFENKDYLGYDVSDFTAEEARILIVDDNEINLMIAKDLLEPMKVKVDTANSGYTAIEMIMEHPYNIVFMDYVMPHFNGVSTTREIRKLAELAETQAVADYLRELVIIALSGDVTDDVREKFINAGINDFVEKPVDMKKLKRKLYEWLPDEMIHIVSTETGGLS